MQSGNILQIPFRRTHPYQVSNAIKEYISTKYDQHPTSFSRDLELIDQLRKNAVNALEPHVSGIKKLQMYIAQLIWMGSKFPVEIEADFTWYPALGYHQGHARTSGNVRFELANVMFNLAAMYSQLALSSNRETTDGLKAAASNFCLASGVINYLKTDIVPDLKEHFPEDMDALTLESLEALMLAQAQECFWQKAVKDRLKDASIAKLAAKVSDLYNDAGEWALKSDHIGSEWIHHINAKHYHFAAAAQYRAACDCLEKRKYGEEVARLRDSVNCINEALKETRYINKAVQADLNGLKTRVTEDLKQSEKDNDTIYLLPEPPKSELKPLDRASMVSVRVPKEISHSQEYMGDHGELGKPLFAKLVPYSVHLAASAYCANRDNVVTDIVSQLETLTERIHELLSSLNLPGSLQALEKPLGLPPSVSTHAEEIRQNDGIHKLNSTMAANEKLKVTNRDLYQEGMDLLRAEAGEDEAARRKFGTDRWNRPTGKDAMPKLHAQIDEIDGYLKQSEKSDRLLQNKLRENESLIRLLGGSDRDLEDYVPSSRRATVTSKVEREANILRATLNEVNRLETRRRRTVETLRAKAREDDVNPDLLKEAARLERDNPMQPLSSSQFDPLFTERLNKRYDSDKDDVKKEEKDQQVLLSRVAEANTSFQTAKRGDKASDEREKALQNLENAYMTYKELLRNLEVARKFYNDLSSITTRFRDESRNFVYTRRSEGQQIESDLSNAMAGLNIQQSTQQHLMQQKQAQAQLPASPAPQTSVRPPVDAIAAPKPQRGGQAPPPVVNSVQSPPVQATWQECMPIVFGGSTQAQGPKKPVDGRWDAQQGVKFGGR